MPWRMGCRGNGERDTANRIRKERILVEIYIKYGTIKIIRLPKKFLSIPRCSYMAVFTVNGRTVAAEKNQKLLRFLRDELRLTSVKDGCSEGACGTCHVLIDGKATKACVPSTDKLEGKTVLTVEGLSDWEKAVYPYAFGKAGAVQCGFCIPGTV